MRLINDSDLGFHLRAGQWIWKHGRVPMRDTFTYTVHGRSYIDMHWLYQLILYGFYCLGGYRALTGLNIILILSSFILIWKRFRMTSDIQWLGIFLLIVVILASEIRFRMRPEVLSWLLMNSTLWILDEWVDKGKNFLFWLPVFQLIWVNIEGLFAIGWGLMGFYLIFSSWKVKKIDRKLMGYSVLAVGMDFLNPQTLRGFLHPFYQLETLTTSNIFKSSVQEFFSPWKLDAWTHWAISPYLFIYKGFCIFYGLLLLATFKHRKVHEWLLSFTFLGLSFSAVRNIPLFMMVSAPIVVSSWQDFHWDRLKTHLNRFFSRWWIAGVGVLFLGVLSVQIITNAYYVAGLRTDRFGLGLNLIDLPVQACRFLHRYHLRGRVINQLDAGGWLDWRGYSNQTFIDGRLSVMGKKFYTVYIQSLQQPQGLEGLIQKYHPQIIFFNPTLADLWTSDLSRMPRQWRLVYVDGAAAIYLQNSYAPQVPAITQHVLLSEHGISRAIVNHFYELVNQSYVTQRRTRWKDWFQPSRYSTSLLNLAIFSTYDQHPRTAVAFLLEDIKRTRGRAMDLIYDLGCVYYYAHQYLQSRICMQRVLIWNPHIAFAQQIVNWSQ